MPKPSLSYYKFEGWYLGDVKVTEDTVFTEANNVTLTALWTKNPSTGWTLKSNMPSDAQIVDTKYSYTQTSYTENKATSLSGWIRYDAYWVYSGGGTEYYADFPSGFYSDSWYYQYYKRNPVSAYENTTNKRVVNNSFYAYIYWHWCRGYVYGNRNGWVEDYSNTNSHGTFNTFHAFDSTYNSTERDSAGVCYKYDDTGKCPNTYWWYRFPGYRSDYSDYYKMFKYSKNENKESTSYPYGSNISNIQEWVQYIAK